MYIYEKQEKQKLTLNDLKDAKSNSILLSGYGYIEHPWFNDAVKTLENDGRSTLVKWVAVRGYIADWAIYHSLDANLEPAKWLDGTEHLQMTFHDVAKYGQKIYSKEIIKSLVDCDEEVLKRYRF